MRRRCTMTYIESQPRPSFNIQRPAVQGHIGCEGDANALCQHWIGLHACAAAEGRMHATGADIA